MRVSRVPLLSRVRAVRFRRWRVFWRATNRTRRLGYRSSSPDPSQPLKNNQLNYWMRVSRVPLLSRPRAARFGMIDRVRKKHGRRASFELLIVLIFESVWPTLKIQRNSNLILCRDKREEKKKIGFLSRSTCRSTMS